MISFKSCGYAGDLIYSLPVVRAFGEGAASMYLGNLAAADKRKKGESFLSSVRPLLLAQPYVAKVESWVGQATCYDLDQARSLMTGGSLLDINLRAFGLPARTCNSPWLSVPSNKVARVVINRTERYRSTFPWRKVVQKFVSDFGWSDLVFVGLPREHAQFERQFGSVPYYPTKNHLELASVIAGCDLFLGNASCAYAIADAMKKKCVYEASDHHVSGFTQREGSITCSGDTLFLPSDL